MGGLLSLPRRPAGGGPATTDPLARLSEEHAGFLEGLRGFEAALDAMMAARQASDAGVQAAERAVRLLEEGVLPHLEREERFLLPPLEAKVGRTGSLVGVVIFEHAEIRREVGKIKAALAALTAARPGPRAGEVEELNRHGIFTVQFLWDHFRKEGASLFPTAREVLAPAELEALAASFGR